MNNPLTHSDLAEMSSQIHSRSNEEESDRQSGANIDDLSQPIIQYELAPDGARVIPLTSAQKDLWVMTQIGDDASCAYNESISLHLRGPLDVAAMRRAIQKVVDSHEALRITISLDGNCQRVAPALTIDAPLVDYSQSDGDGQDARVAEFLTRNSRQPFDIVRGPLFRACIIKLEPWRHILALTFHHLVADGWSTSVLLKDLGALYSMECQGKEAQLPKPAQLSGYVRYLEGQQQSHADIDERYWLQRLEGLSAFLHLPTDRPRPSTKTYAGARQSMKLDSLLSSRVANMGAKYKCTIFATLLAGFNLLLHRLTGQDDIVVGIPTAEQAFMGGKSLIGYCVNPLLLRSRIAEDPLFTRYLFSVKKDLLGAYEHRICSLNTLMKKLALPRDASRAPLVEVVFNLNQLSGLPEFFKLDAEVVRNVTGFAKLDMDWNLIDASGEITLVCDYNTDLFDACAIQRWMRHFQTLLEGLVDNPDRRLSLIPLFKEDEYIELLKEWDITQAVVTQNDLAHQLFEKQAARTPNSIALVFEQESLTYLELNARANQLAHYLRRLGVGPEVIVGFYLDRSIEMVIALLGIMKAGGAYLPLDPLHPHERISFMLEDAKAHLLLTQNHLLDQSPSQRVFPICLDSDWAIIAAEGSANPTNQAGPENSVYVIYTSGSTGVPKGVVIEHQGLCNLAEAQRLIFALGREERLLQFASIGFDASIFEIMMALCSGATLCLARREVLLPGASLISVLRDLAITTVTLPPAALAVMWQGVGAGLPALKTMISAGEAIDAETVKRWNVGRRFFNAYGPTEATVWATTALCKAESERSPIGKPIANTQIYLLDKHLQLAPVGVRGELYIHGAGLARGYLNSAELTAESFVPHPYNSAMGARLYRTGDITRYAPDGNIEFLGRADNQVKVHGYRIELGEIESVLTKHPMVSGAAVIIREESAGDKRLTAYVTVATDEDALLFVGLRDYLKERLPEYMVPAVFVLMDEFPLTPGGKLDRRALPAPNQVVQRERYLAPRTPAEQALCAVWAEALQIEKVGVLDNFFELGGDSILAIQTAWLANQHGLTFDPGQLFERQTIAELSAVVGEAASVEAEAGVVEGPLPLTPIEHWFFEQNLVDPHHFNQALMLEVNQSLDAGLIEAIWRELLVHHDALRLRFVRESAGWRQFNAGAEQNRVFIHVDLSQLAETDESASIEEAAAEIQRSLDLSEGPLIRVALFDVGSQRPSRLLIAVHHLAIDGVSWRILLSDFQEAYRQLKNGEPIKLPGKTSSFKEWAEKLAARARSGIDRREIDFWLAVQNENLSPLPIDYPHGSNNVKTARAATVQLDEQETRGLLQNTSQAYHTQINDILLTALAQTFRDWSGDRSLLIDLEWHGRGDVVEHLDLSRTVGWFTSIFPVVLEIGENTAPGSALKSIKEQLRSVPSHGINYGLLRYNNSEEEIAGRLRRRRGAELCFNYLGQFDQVLVKSAPFRVAMESAGPNRSLRGGRRYLLEINAGVINGKLHIDWTYSGEIHAQSTIENLAGRYIEALRSLIAHCQSVGAHSYTPSDFPLARLDQKRLDKILETKSLIEDLYPLSPMQQGLLFHSLYASEAGAYLEQLSCVLCGDLNLPSFIAAWQRLVDRHTILRTSFIWEGVEEPLQLVHQEVVLPFDQHDWRGLSLSEQERQLKLFLEADRRRGFQLTAAPLMRLTIFQTGDRKYRLVWTHHHLLLDGWCLPLILDEVNTLYQALSNGHEIILEQPHPYRDYIAWLQKQNASKAEAFWRRTLRGFYAPTPLVPDRAERMTPGRQEEYAEHQRPLPVETAKELQLLARRNQLTLYTLLQGGWALLLSRYSQREDVVFGGVVAARPADLSGSDSMLGLFINALPVRTQVAPNDSVISWLKNLQTRQVESRQYEYSSLVEIQGWSELPRGVPIFESILVFENYPIHTSIGESEGEKDGGQLLASEFLSVKYTSYPLTMVAIPRPELCLELCYDKRRFDEVTIGRMMTHFEVLLNGIAGGIERRVDEIPMLTPAELRQLLVDWNNTDAEYPRNSCIHELVEARVAQIPNAIAIISSDEQVSYNEMNRRANQLARYLRRLGVRAESLVAILVERSFEMAYSFLGVLKAGGAYLPLDPSYPKQRLAKIIEDAGVSVILTQHRLINTLPDHEAPVIRLDTDWEEISLENEENLSGEARPENLAYVIYTSGSTGKPKGALISHAALVNYTIDIVQKLRLRPEDKILQFASVGFDVVIEELFPSWMCGATVILRGDDLLDHSTGLLQLIEEERLTAFELPTAYWHELARQISRSEKPLPASLRFLIVGGERLSSERLAAWRKSGVPLIHVYGLTETTVTSTLYQLPDAAGNEAAPSALPIGRPLANTQIYLLNSRLQPVPIGAQGEVYIGGEGLARGYLNEPYLTGERFIPSPFGDRTSARLYRTGDLARYLPDGNLEFIGRFDDQVKIRGFRIELGEIEVALREQVGVADAVVVAREDESGDKRLTAYLVAEPGVDLETAGLRSLLKERLPDYMTPAAFMALESLPLTSNGKIDRFALPIPDRGGFGVEVAFVAPRNGVEEALADIWAEVLGLERVGIQDDFFALGGHSLLVTQVVSRVREVFDVDLPLRSVFEMPTVANLVVAVIQLQAEQRDAADVARILEELEPLSDDTGAFDACRIIA